MPLQWDRLFETCYRREAADLLLKPGSPPLLRLPGCWRALQVEPVTADHFRLLLSEFDDRERLVDKGYWYFDLQYRGLTGFRVMLFGQPVPEMVIVSRLRDNDDGSKPSGDS